MNTECMRAYRKSDLNIIALNHETYLFDTPVVLALFRKRDDFERYCSRDISPFLFLLCKEFLLEKVSTMYGEKLYPK